MGYQDRDRHIIDYHLYRIPGMQGHPGGGVFRGPKVTAAEYITCIGGAQTFGCYCEHPFPALLGKELSVASLNLGSGGAGPTFHQSNPVLMSLTNGARLAIVQMYSGRSISNSRFHITHHGMEGVDSLDGRRMTAAEFFKEVIVNEPQSVMRLVNKTRRNYVDAFVRLLRSIAVPKILFWFSIRKPQYKESVELPIWKLWGAFPQFVNLEMVDEIRPHADDYVECVSDIGLPQLLLDRNGAPASVKYRYDLLTDTETVQTHNTYYPSPEMHALASRMLVPVCRKYLPGYDRP